MLKEHSADDYDNGSYQHQQAQKTMESGASRGVQRRRRRAVSAFCDLLLFCISTRYPGHADRRDEEMKNVTLSPNLSMKMLSDVLGTPDYKRAERRVALHAIQKREAMSK